MSKQPAANIVFLFLCSYFGRRNSVVSVLMTSQRSWWRQWSCLKACKVMHTRYTVIPQIKWTVYVFIFLLFIMSVLLFWYDLTNPGWSCSFVVSSESLLTPGLSLRCWPRLHRQDSPVGHCQRPAHQRRAHHRPTVRGRGEEPWSVAQHGSAAVQGLHSYGWGHQVGDGRTPPHTDHLLFSDPVLCLNFFLALRKMSLQVCLWNSRLRKSFSDLLQCVFKNREWQPRV